MNDGKKNKLFAVLTTEKAVEGDFSSCEIILGETEVEKEKEVGESMGLNIETRKSKLRCA